MWGLGCSKTAWNGQACPPGRAVPGDLCARPSLVIFRLEASASWVHFPPRISQAGRDSVLGSPAVRCDCCWAPPWHPLGALPGSPLSVGLASKSRNLDAAPTAVVARARRSNVYGGTWAGSVEIRGSIPPRTAF